MLNVKATTHPPLEYWAVAQPTRRIAPLNPVLKRHLVAMITTGVAAIAMLLISLAMLQGRL